MSVCAATYGTHIRWMNNKIGRYTIDVPTGVLVSSSNKNDYEF